MKILVIEDDEPILQAITFKLIKEGFEVEGAEDGVIGLEKIKNGGPFSLVLLDLRMPKGDGFKFLEAKKEDENIKDVPVIVFTNLSQREYIDRALGLGVKGYLVKAYHGVQEIVDEVKKCIEVGSAKIDNKFLESN
jgi:DNA-binding response OmpR family regulator